MLFSPCWRRAAPWLLLAGAGLAVGCSSAPERPAASPAPPRPDPAAAVIRPFFQQYRARMGQREYHFVAGGLAAPNPTYRLDQPEIAAYLRMVAACGPVSPAYLARLRAHFRQVGQQLARTPQNDGEIEGLEYDLVVHDGDFDDFALSLDTARLRLRQLRPPARLYALGTGVDLVVKVVPTAKGWQIDSVDTDPLAP